MSGLIFRTFALCLALVFSIGASMAGNLPTLSNSQSGVTIKVTPKSLNAETWEFNVVFDTHSQELKDDLLKSAVLVDAAGTQISPIDWKGAPPGGHHREGVLRFNVPAPAPSAFELRFVRPGEQKPRSFKWTLK
ncbi:MAG: hypothetical protein A3I66_16060 [Burkholderiales bacterium RIFCSPLOWO2_02_FULL_57_36]|nr:MAG: hypothetical protein A3I66_16060 [Burkholderiales bacterium RIFCSPLOWO2_02_FULL_57_36]